VVTHAQLAISITFASLGNFQNHILNSKIRLGKALFFWLRLQVNWNYLQNQNGTQTWKYKKNHKNSLHGINY